MADTEKIEFDIKRKVFPNSDSFPDGKYSLEENRLVSRIRSKKGGDTPYELATKVLDSLGDLLISHEVIALYARVRYSKTKGENGMSEKDTRDFLSKFRCSSEQINEIIEKANDQIVKKGYDITVGKMKE